MTADEPRVRVTTNLAFGICLILLGTILILDRLQLVAASHLLRFWPVALVLFGAALVIQSVQRPTTTTPAPTDDLRLGHVLAFVIFMPSCGMAFRPEHRRSPIHATGSRSSQLPVATTVSSRPSDAAAADSGARASRSACHSGRENRFIESQDDYVSVRTGGRSFLKEQPLGELEGQLDPAVFVRIHRRYLLNVSRLAKIETGVTDSRVAVLHDGSQLPISRTGYGRLKELL